MTRTQLQTIVQVVVAATAWGGAMAAQGELKTFWARALVAGIGGGFLGIAASPFFMRSAPARPSGIAVLICFLIVFSCLMGVMDIFESLWARALVGAIAGGIFIVGIALSRRPAATT